MKIPMYPGFHTIKMVDFPASELLVSREATVCYPPHFCTKKNTPKRVTSKGRHGLETSFRNDTTTTKSHIPLNPEVKVPGSGIIGLNKNSPEKKHPRNLRCRYPKLPFFSKGPVTCSKAYHFGTLQPLFHPLQRGK